MTEKLSQAGCDTIRASVMRPVTDNHGSAGEIRRGGKEIACGRKDTATRCNRRWGNVEGR